MGCFLACFGGSQENKRRRSTPKILPRNTNRWHRHHELAVVPASSVKSQPPIAEIQKKPNSVQEFREVEKEKQQSPAKVQKKVSFDLEVKTYIQSPCEEQEETESPLLKETSSYSDEEDGGVDKEEEDEEDRETRTWTMTSSEENSSSSTTGFSYPVSHRYENCRISDDEDEFEEDDNDEVEDGDDEIEELFGWYSSSLSIESATRGIFPVFGFAKLGDQTTVSKVAAAIVGNVRHRSQYIQPVLNPVENRMQWNALKTKESNPKMPMMQATTKENILSEKETVIKSTPIRRNDIAVDASLSTWLKPAEKTSTDANSNTPQIPKACHTTEGISLSPTNTFPGRVLAESKHDASFAEKLIGSENQGIPNTTSKYREDKGVNWHSTPFEVRLERVLKGSAQAY